MNKHIYTEERLDAMSDFELNKAVADKLGLNGCMFNEGSGYILAPEQGLSEKDNEIILASYSKFDPLNDFNDCMPIAERYGIAIIPKVLSGWWALHVKSNTHMGRVSQPTIQRAIVYCYLTMEVD